MSHKDAEDLAAEIAWMQDDPSFHPKYNPKAEKDDLHKYIVKLENDLIKEREKNYKLTQKIQNIVNEFRNQGDL